MSKYYAIDASGQPTAICAAPIPGLGCVPATPELDSAWEVIQQQQAAASPEMPAAYSLPKWVISERIIQRGLLPAFKQALESDLTGELAARWDALIEIDSDSPLLQQALPALLAALGCTPEDASQILRPGREIP